MQSVFMNKKNENDILKIILIRKIFKAILNSD